MSVKVKETAEWVARMMLVLEGSWGCRKVMEDEGGDPVRMIVQGNDLLGRLIDLGRSGVEYI